MRSKYILPLLFVLIIFGACRKNGNTDTGQLIDVSDQWETSGYGFVVSGTQNGQWEAATFSAKEQALFNCLDTADLTGTSKPDSIVAISAPVRNTFSYPNPYPHFFYIPCIFTKGYDGFFVMKAVIVDSMMRIVYKTTKKLQPVFFSQDPLGQSFINVPVDPNLAAGKYRLYYTFSTAANLHFYKCWGNIEKMP